MKSASPQDTYNHIFGSGASQYDWWHKFEYVGRPANEDGQMPTNWQMAVTADDGNDSERTKTVNHKTVMNAAHYILKNKKKQSCTNSGIEYPAWTTRLVKECKNLIFNADYADFDACIADELLQVIVLGEVIFS